jgi:hypothetical protein
LDDGIGKLDTCIFSVKLYLRVRITPYNTIIESNLNTTQI